MKKAFYILSLLMLPQCLFAQLNEEPVNRFEIGAQLRNNGWGVTFQKFTRFAASDALNWKFGSSLNTLKHPKELKIVNASNDRSKPYVFGRVNKFGTLNAYTGLSHSLSKGNYRGRPSINTSVVAGFSLGILRPVYLDIDYVQQDGRSFVVSEKYDPEKHTNQGAIIGESRGATGWNELSFVPGFNIKVASQFLWTNASGGTNAFEIGVDIQTYFKRPYVMSGTANSKFWPSLYIGYLIGKQQTKDIFQGDY